MFIVDFLTVALPTVIAILSVVVGIKSTKGKIHKSWWIAILIAGILGIVASTVTLISQNHARKEHEREIGEQKQAMERLSVIINTNEIRNAGDMGYLRAKLEDSEKWNDKLSQFAPAVMRLAESTAEFTRKQYEVKITNDKELYKFTINVVKKIRDFSDKYRRLSDQQNDELMSSTRQNGLTEAEMRERWDKRTQKIIQLHRDRDNEFRTSILPDALYANQELTKRNLPEPTMSSMIESTVDMVKTGILAGVYPELALADYLELMAKPLSLK